MYPIRCDGVELMICEDDYGAEFYCARNAAGEEYTISYPILKALIRADGTRPLLLPEDDVDLLAELIHCGLVQTSRLVKGKQYDRLILFTFGDKVRKARPLCKLLNALLPVSSILIFILGVSILLWQNSGRIPMDDYSLLLYYALVLVSLFVHEAAHLISAVAFGYPVSEAGVIFYLKIFPACLYVGHGRKKNATKGEEIQLALAGIEANLLATGMFLLTAVLWDEQKATFFTAAITNIFFIIANLIPAKGLEDDGEVALNNLFEVKSIYPVAKKCVRSKKHRRKLIHSAGLAGIACIMLFRLILFTNEKHILWNGFILVSPVVFMWLYCTG